MKRPPGFYSASFVVLTMCLSAPTFAQETSAPPPSATAQDSAAVVYEDPTGVTVEFEPDGSDWKRIYSTGEADLSFGDRKDLQNARRKAELEAKAAIAKFLNETIKSEETLEDITKTMTDSNANKAGKDTTANRKTVETVTNKISNSADAILRGVMALEQKEDIPNKRVTVKVGMSRKTMATADSVKRTLQQNSGQPQMAPPPPPTSSGIATDPAGEPTPTTTIRRSKNANDF
ncbi:MAG: hypothetical protein IPL99_08365 [Candidatus Competibacteraceae bacterium]|nr:hypothetical protein [Candidatus Competibacteraceae bacterium]